METLLRTVIITQARFGSSRLPGKVLKPLGKNTALDLHLARLKLSKEAEAIWVATTEEVESPEILKVAERQGVHSYQGSLDDVLDRFYQTAVLAKADIVVRVTSDCPLNDGRLIDQLVQKFREEKVDYLSNVMKPSFADGLDAEVFSFKALAEAWQKGISKAEREHVTPYLYDPTKSFRRFNFENTSDESDLRITMDYEEDYELIKHLVENIGEMNPWQDYVKFLKANPDLRVRRVRNETLKL